MGLAMLYFKESGVVISNTRHSRNFNITGGVRQGHSMQIAT